MGLLSCSLALVTDATLDEPDWLNSLEPADLLDPINAFCSSISLSSLLRCFFSSYMSLFWFDFFRILSLKLAWSSWELMEYSPITSACFFAWDLEIGLLVYFNSLSFNLYAFLISKVGAPGWIAWQNLLLALQDLCIFFCRPSVTLCMIWAKIIIYIRRSDLNSQIVGHLFVASCSKIEQWPWNTHKFPLWTCRNLTTTSTIVWWFAWWQINNFD